MFVLMISFFKSSFFSFANNPILRSRDSRSCNSFFLLSIFLWISWISVFLPNKIYDYNAIGKCVQNCFFHSSGADNDSIGAL